MTARVLEAVPNFSEGRDAAAVHDITDAMRGAGAEVLHCTSDPDHHRSVVTLVGTPEVVEAAAVAAARVAVERIDLRYHGGAHPRIGAVDVLPFVPLVALSLEDAREAARRVGRRLAEEVGVPVYFYGAASEPPGRTLGELRRGGFEELVRQWPADRPPDLLPPGWPHPGAHPRAGITCVGARPLLIAWNVYLAGVSKEAAHDIAARVRAQGGGFRGVRALALMLEERRALQISMNLEDLEAAPPMDVFRRIEELAASAGGRVAETEVVGMLPDELVLTAAAERLRLSDATLQRMLSRRLVDHLAARLGAANRKKV